MPATARPTMSAVENTVDDAADDAKSFADRAAGKMSDGVSNAADFVSDSVKSVTSQMPRIGEWIDDQLGRLRDTAQEKPVQTVAIAVGIGALLGAIFMRR